MNIVSFTKGHIKYKKQLQHFLKQRVIPVIDKWEEDALLPKSIWQEMGAEGLLCPTVSKKFGGIGGDYLYSVILAEELAKTNHWGLAANHHSDITKHYIEQYAGGDLKKKYIPKCISGEFVCAMATTEPDCGSDLFATKTQAVEEDGQIIINGSKTFISNGYWSDLVVILAREPSENHPDPILSLFLVPTDAKGVKRGNPFKKLGWRSQDTSEFFFNDCRIPVENRIGKKGSGLSIFMENIQSERLIMSIQAVTLAETIYEKTKQYCVDKSDATDRDISQTTQFDLVDIATEIKLGRTFIDYLVMENRKKTDILTEITMSKCWTTEMSNRVISKCLDIIGEDATLDDYPVSRAYRDARVLRIAGGSTETLKDVMVEMIGLKDPKTTMKEEKSALKETVLSEIPDTELCIMPEGVDQSISDYDITGKPTNEILIDIVNKLVGSDSVTEQDKFIELEMDSLLAVRFVWKIREVFSIEALSIGDVLEAKNVRNLTPIVDTHLVNQKKSSPIPAISQIVGRRYV